VLVHAAPQRVGFFVFDSSSDREGHCSVPVSYASRRKGGTDAVGEAEQRGASVEGAVAAEEGRAGGDAEPELADEGGAEEVRELVRREAEEDLGDGVVDELRRWGLGAVREGRRRRQVSNLFRPIIRLEVNCLRASARFGPSH
jgi:hypothetical protein